MIYICIDDILISVQGSTSFSKHDLESGFHFNGFSLASQFITRF